MVQRELVELARNGDRESFSALAASVVDRLYATADPTGCSTRPSSAWPASRSGGAGWSASSEEPP
jgi:hypothetical protein